MVTWDNITHLRCFLHVLAIRKNISLYFLYHVCLQWNKNFGRDLKHTITRNVAQINPKTKSSLTLLYEQLQWNLNVYEELVAIKSIIRLQSFLCSKVHWVASFLQRDRSSATTCIFTWKFMNISRILMSF